MFGKKMAKVVTVLAFVLAATAALAAAPVVYLDNYAEFGGVVNADGGVGFAPLSKAGVFKAGVLIYDGTVDGGVTLTADTEFPAGSYFSAYFMKYKVEYDGEDTGDSGIVVKEFSDLTEEIVEFLSEAQDYTREDGHAMKAIAVQAKKLFTVDVTVTVDCQAGNGLNGYAVKAAGEQLTLRFDLTPEEVRMDSLEDLGQVADGTTMADADFPTGVEESDWGKATAKVDFSVAEGAKLVLSREGKKVLSVYKGQDFFFIEADKFGQAEYTSSEGMLKRLAAPQTAFKLSPEEMDGNSSISLTWLGTSIRYIPAKGNSATGQIQGGGITVNAENSMVTLEENSDGTITAKVSGGPAGAMTIWHGPSFGKSSGGDHGHNGGGSGGGGGCNASGLCFAPLALVGMLFARKRF